MLAGLRFIWTQPTLRALLLRSVAAFLSMGPIFSFYVLYTIRDLHLTTSMLGIAISLGGVGSIVGAYLAGRMRSPHVMVATALITTGTHALLPLAGTHASAIAYVCVQQLVGDCAWTIYFVNAMYLRQSLAPEALLGRVNGAMQFASRGMLPIGALISAWLSHYLSITNLLWLGTGGLAVSVLFLLPLLNQPAATSCNGRDPHR
jgi:predicted MFS family arabinose efflux permease